jgi:P-type Ca2+ transporter type 2C
MSVQIAPDAPAEWHAMTIDEVAETLSVDTGSGLSATEVTARQARYGPNALRSAPPAPWWKLLVGQFTDGLILVLLGAAALSLLIGEIEEAVFIAVLLVVNGVLGFWQERQAQQSLAAIQALVVPQARVRRDGAVQRIPADQLVPGDVVLLEAGDIAPADGRLIGAFRLAMAEAALTGEAYRWTRTSSRSGGRPPSRTGPTWLSLTPPSPRAGRRCSSPVPAWTPKSARWPP